ncbi:glycosyltransferase family 4 protein [Mesorhizobium sp. B1-1-8]|uniref:glycosyltransferase family 4 protein n=1 Tax=Mesorhizobium sp. B1-1-8 TaxID=2589976 RepID=UPI0011283526|nr:glycosyltransferase family 4 protein [Mesorhizobium sp. B1-1-8]UCI07134.1 glycosyltransferase family 4 protein [Mesorhizobium sp. B1-1-8]
MRIVQVQTQAEAAGAQRISDMVGEGLRARGHDVRTVFMYRKTEAYDGDAYADFVLTDRPKGLPGQIRAIIGLAAYLRRARPDAVITYQHYGNLFGTIGARLAGVGHIVANQSGAPHGKGVMGLLSRIDKLMGVVGLYQANVVNSGWTEAQFEGYPLAYRRRIRRIDHGVPTPGEEFDKATARASFGLPQNAWLAVSSGRLTRFKNQIALVGALELLPDLHLGLAGAGPERDTLLTLAESRGMAERLHLVGEVPPARIFEFLAAGDIYAFPSTSETFGMACVEAAISGLPIVASDLAVLREVLTAEDGEPAALFVEPDATGMAKGLAAMVAAPELRARLSAAGRRLKEKYSPARMCAAYEALLIA